LPEAFSDFQNYPFLQPLDKKLILL
jgi:hypothetical protein